MFYAYVIKSIEHDFFYKGHCENLDDRLRQHNYGMTESIRPYIPFKVVYFESLQGFGNALFYANRFLNSLGVTPNSFFT